ncbi:MAG: hypothetical protein A2X36_08340 [Elusimicrobia bacterium GWA2_69_24]|nr:MAG: hypothetical protein A2X36_08340 [Elusimicrobia bacterium GWA2_69_24]HBL15376.1 hypothetical protein [Elusimicrobiota bacterium]
MTALSLALAVPAVRAQSAPSALQSSNLLNPNVSVIGWFQGEAGGRSRGAGGAEPAAFALREAELGLQSVVDPYAKADFFIAVGGDGGVELEEGYLNWFALPYGLALKTGKFRADFGKFNRTHPPETAFADRPLVHERFLGEEGLSGMGGALSWQVPVPWLFVSVDAQALTSPEAAEVPAFDQARKRDLLYVGRVATYYDLSESVNAGLGASGAWGNAGQDIDPVSGSSATLVSRLGGLDLTLRWKDPRRAVYRSAFWQTEMLWGRRGAPGGSAVGAKGLFTHVEYQFAQRWRAGARYDYTELPADGSVRETGGLAYLTFMPSEFSLISLQGRRARRQDGSRESLAWLKMTFNIGPHGAHPF